MSLKQNTMLRNILKSHLESHINIYRFNALRQESGLPEDLDYEQCLDLILNSLDIEEVQAILGVYYE